MAVAAVGEGAVVTAVVVVAVVVTEVVVVEGAEVVEVAAATAAGVVAVTRRLAVSLVKKWARPGLFPVALIISFPVFFRKSKSS
jgi:hypothetical protein